MYQNCTQSAVQNELSQFQRTPSRTPPTSGASANADVCYSLRAKLAIIACKRTYVAVRRIYILYHV